MKRRWMWVVAAGVAATVVLLAWLGPYFGRRHLTGSASRGIPRGRNGWARRPEVTDAVPPSPSGDRNDHGRGRGHELIDLSIAPDSDRRDDSAHSGWAAGQSRPVAPARDTPTAHGPFARAGRDDPGNGSGNAERQAETELGIDGPDLVQLTDQGSTSAPTASVF